MLWAIRQIIVPCNYLRIRHGKSLLQSKAVFDFVLPLILTAATALACLWLDVPLAVFKHSALVKHLLDLLALMIVFYMAALAAVATFDREGIDELLPDNDATLMVRDPDGGAWKPKALTYRQFISYLFGYLSFLSLSVYVTLVFLTGGWPKLQDSIIGIDLSKLWIFERVLNPITFVIVFFAIWQLICTSLLGIYFLTERIQTLNEPKR